MSNLDQVVPDIYKLLEQLGDEGGDLPLTEENIDLALAGMKESILKWSKPPKRDTDFTLRMSNVGAPTRQLWFKKRDEDQGRHDGSTQIKFLMGHILEEIVLMLVRMTDHKVTDCQKEVEVNGIKGHMDCKINGEVVDVKSASKFAFRKFQNGTLYKSDSFGYLSQLGGYEASEGTKDGGFLVINKESGELCLHVPKPEHKIDTPARIESLIPILDVDTMPELCYNPEPDGSSGNMKINQNCVWCKYKWQCFPDLRVFEYSNGKRYLSTVVVEPKVSEALI